MEPLALRRWLLLLEGNIQDMLQTNIQKYKKLQIKSVHAHRTFGPVKSINLLPITLLGTCLSPHKVAFAKKLHEIYGKKTQENKDIIFNKYTYDVALSFSYLLVEEAM